jgi:hypothetical protein
MTSSSDVSGDLKSVLGTPMSSFWFSVLEVQQPLPIIKIKSMGNDGGSIPKRSEMVKQEKRRAKKVKSGQGSSVCSLTKEALRMPLVVCRRGLIYNKESLIKKMLDKTMPFEFRHIRKLSNLVTVSAASFDPETKQVCCSVSRELLSDLKPFKIYHCGCVVSEAALSELQTKEDIDIDSCVVCGHKLENELIALNQSNYE